jgi:asparagine synthase (glutamine-hydrolysing)
VSELAKKHVTVVLSGDGGDEVFGGYYLHKAAARIEVFRNFPAILRRLSFYGADQLSKKLRSDFVLEVREGLRLTLSDNKNFYKDLLSRERYLPKSAEKWYVENLGLLLKDYPSLTESIIKFDLAHNSLADNFLVKVDRASMLNSLEVRCPFLDYRMLEFSNKIPTNYKVDFFRTKKIMREIIKDRVPKEILFRGKMGFNPPIMKWLRKDYREMLESELDNVQKSGILSGQQSGNLIKLRAILEKNPKGKKDGTMAMERLYRYFVLSKWAKRWL